jgi:long-chain acyl-CoA synthetase
MVDKSLRIVRPEVSLRDVETLKGKRIEFDSCAQMLAVRAQEIPDSPYALYYDETVTYAQTNERSNRVANYLKGRGVVKSDTVSVMILNSPDIYYTMFGAQKLGATVGSINYMLKGPEIAYVLDDSKPKVAFVGSEYMAEFTRGWNLSKQKPIVVEVLTEADHKSDIAETTLQEIMDAYPASECLVPQSLDDPFMLLYSSGTTGMPKGVVLSNRNQFAICESMAKNRMFKPGDVHMIVLPMFHTNPLNVFTYPLMYQGLALCIRKSFSPSDFWPSLTRYGVTFVFAVPAMYSYVYRSVDPATIDYSRLKLRYGLSGAAPLPRELLQGFKEKFNVQMIEGWGLTEATGCGTLTYGAPENLQSVGIGIYGLEVEIMDDANNILPYGEHGEICAKGDAVMVGYLNKPEATAETIRDGWLHSGDRGSMDERGYIYFHGRTKEMINRGGENIYPREIEIPLERHPKIAEVAVVGAPDPALGERVRACIVLHPSCSMSAEEVKEYLSDKIAKYKLPEYVEFMAALPRNPTGKVLKQDLKKMAFPGSVILK